MPNRTPILISVDDDHLPQIQKVAARLRAAGMTIDSVLKDLGTITGSVDPAKLSTLSKIEGVAAAEASRDYQLPPPDADVQ
jgi:DNA anti-recombination protein RmuC